MHTAHETPSESTAIAPMLATNAIKSAQKANTPEDTTSNERPGSKAKALVSKVEGEAVLTCEVLLAGQVKTAHLDSCASHCFLSSRTSKELASRGYPSVTSPITFEVSQGQPLCDSNRVHYLPLSIVREDGRISTWNECMFIVADAGAPIIVCNTLLRLGGIMKYDPPQGYASLLAKLSSSDLLGHRSATQGARRILPTNDAQSSFYQAPSRTSSKCLHTALQGSAEAPTREMDSKLSPNKKAAPPQTRGCDGPMQREKVQSQGDSEHSETKNLADPTVATPTTVLATNTAQSAGNKARPQPKRRGETTMLSEEDPYGKNPPLPEEVLEAVKHLKLLSDPSTTPAYTPQQIEEIRFKLTERRPKWAHCLTLQKTIEVADLPTEQFINDLMDKPKYQNSIFSSCMKKCCDLREYEINQHPGRDLWTPPQPRRFKNPNTTLIIDAWLDALIDNEKCRESTASHPAPITVVEKDMRDPRVCIDYRNRNSRTDVPAFPMPDVHDFLDETAGFKYYCSFDMAKMFNQFKIKEEHKHLAAFITHRGVYEPNVVMFGLQGGPQHAVREAGGAMATDPLTNGIEFTKWALEQNAMGGTPPYEICPSTKVAKGSRLRPFIDDVTIPSNHTEGMKKLVDNFFEFCFKHNLILSKKKAKIMKTHLRMLGFVVSEEGKHLDPQRIITLLEAKKPQSKETLHSLLSSYTFVRMFIPNFASIAAPLHEATKGIIWKGPGSGRSKGIRETDPDFVWTPEMTRAYEQLRNALLEAPILVKVDWRYPLFLSVDASLRGEGWVLWQLITTADGAKAAVAILYGSRKYSETERNWETTRQEVNAMRSALTNVEDYVFGQHFYVFSDHLNLRFMHNSVNRAVIRLRDFLSQFNMTVIHCPGIWNNADSISRLENERLPIELAQNLNASTAEAKLEGTLTKFSIGTSTDEDPYYQGNIDLQPSRPNVESKDDSQMASVLCTSVNSAYKPVANHCTHATRCLLCNATGLPNAQYESEEEPDMKVSTCLATAAEPNPVLNDSQFEQWETIVNHWARNTKVPIPQLREAANVWNARYHTEQRPGIPPYFADSGSNEEDRERENDLEDLRWCGRINRSAVVLLAAAGARFKPRSLSSFMSPPNSPNNKSKKQVRFNLSEEGERPKARTTSPLALNPIPSTPTPEPDVEPDPERTPYPFFLPPVVTTEIPAPPLPIEEIILPETSAGSVEEPARIREVIDIHTQTTPADFRIATIRFPMIDDFKAIHGHESGHHGVDYSYRKLIKRCGTKWANERGEATKVKAALKEFVDGCPICQKVRGMKEQIKAKHSFIVSRPFLEVSYDFIILKEDKHGNRNMLVAIDNFLKIVEFRASPNRDAETVATFLLSLGARYGHMARLRSDKDGAFTSLLIEKLNKSRGTETAPCVPYHPQANSICERQNGLIMNHLNALVLECKLGPESNIGWSDLLPEVFSLVNNTPKNPLGISPLSMMYGVFANYDQPLLPTTQANELGTMSNPLDYVDSLMAWQNQLLEVTERIQSDHFDKLQKKLNKDGTPREFHEGDFVLQHKQGTGTSGKPNPRWLGPFLVVNRKNNDPSHPILDLMNLTDMRVKEASIEDCRQFNTSWFEEENLLPELIKIAATDQNEYVVERIVGHKPEGEHRSLSLSKYLFEVKWQDFEETSWEPYTGLKNLEPMEEYSRLHPGLKLDKSK